MVTDNDNRSNDDLGTEDSPNVEIPENEESPNPEKKKKFSLRSLLVPRGAANAGQPVEKSESEVELGLIKVLDFASNDTFEWIYEKKMLENYRNKVITPFVGEDDEADALGENRQRLRGEFYDNNIEGRLQDIISTAEVIAKTKRINRPFIKTWGMIQLAITMVLMIVMVLVSRILQLDNIFIWYMLALCIVPQGIKMLTDRQWKKIKSEITPLLMESEEENLREVKKYIENLLEDLKHRVIAKKMDVKKVQFVLFSSNYNHIQEIQQQPSKGTPKFLVGFGDVEGAASGNDDDLFILLKNAKFGDDGDLTEYDLYYGTESEAERIEKLLNTSTFSSVDNPNDVYKEFNENTSILCECGDPVVFKDLKYCSSKTYKGFEFYMGLGDASACGKEPYVLFTSPGNAEIPEKLKNLF